MSFDPKTVSEFDPLTVPNANTVVPCDYPHANGTITTYGITLAVLGAFIANNYASGSENIDSGWHFRDDGFIYHETYTQDIVIDTDDGGHQWTFGANGRFTLPGGSIYVYDNFLSFGQSEISPPTLDSKAGEKLILWDIKSANAGNGYNYAIGIENDNMWFGVDESPSAGEGFKWYAGNTDLLKLARNGVLTLFGNSYLDDSSGTTLNIGTNKDLILFSVGEAGAALHSNNSFQVAKLLFDDGTEIETAPGVVLRSSFTTDANTNIMQIDPARQLMTASYDGANIAIVQLSNDMKNNVPYTIKSIHPANNKISVIGSNGFFIDDAASANVQGPYCSITVVHYGSGFGVLSKYSGP